MISASEASIEAELRTKGLNAPRLTPDDINSVIVSEQYHRFPGTTMTVCALTLQNGFQVIGESAAASAANFDEQIGKRIAYDNARNKIWMLEGYLLRNMLWRQSREEELKAKHWSDHLSHAKAAKLGEPRG